MFRIKLIIEYDGSNYVGWQRQENGKSVQGEIESSLKKIFNENIELTVAGRDNSILSTWRRRQPAESVHGQLAICSAVQALPMSQ